MILKLLRTDLQSEWLAILLTAAVSFALWITSIGMEMPGYTTSGRVILGLLPFPLLFARLALKRGVQQRRRLLAQLPVTATAIRISSWLSYFTIVAIAYLIGVAMLLISPPAPGWGWIGFAEDAGRTIAVFTCWAALWRIFALAMFMRSPFKYILPQATVFLFVGLLIAAEWFFGGKMPSRDDVTVPWTLFLQVTAGTALALILVDILLDRFVDSQVP